MPYDAGNLTSGPHIRPQSLFMHPKCYVCLDPFSACGKLVRATACGHVYCQPCSIELIQRNMPCSLNCRNLRLQHAEEIKTEFAELTKRTEDAFVREERLRDIIIVQNEVLGPICNTLDIVVGFHKRLITDLLKERECSRDAVLQATTPHCPCEKASLGPLISFRLNVLRARVTAATPAAAEANAGTVVESPDKEARGRKRGAPASRGERALPTYHSMETRARKRARLA
ncbi:hypothetical protein Hypma_005499 [Hypsizygus marmoreus]|uniref:RING-type domain-containing protein n=1 Tax=Hypsizygus marmoreus TaxID=39966 RepID=A0A369K4H6_HYPMA|nr:hypothetical protein Hypma_005499 [Hypsizygus marmoreus]